MLQLIVKAKKLNKRRTLPAFLPDDAGIIGFVKKSFVFEGEEVENVPNPALGKWYKDRDNNFYWGGGLNIQEIPVDENAPELELDNTLLEGMTITSQIKRKIEQVVNVFETGSVTGNYATLVKLKDHQIPGTNTLTVQVTFGRSQTTEFGHLKALVQDYVDCNGIFVGELRPFIGRIGIMPSLATDDAFCSALKKAGTEDQVMRICQDRLFEAKYYQPAFGWFTENGFNLPLSLLVIYDSKIHWGSILPFLRKKSSTVVPSMGGDEKEWITNYVNARHNWLANHTNQLLRNTIYRTDCFKEQIQKGNWVLSQSVNAHGVIVN
jgi:chitosanase